MPQFFWLFQGDEKADEVGDGALENLAVFLGLPERLALSNTPKRNHGFSREFPDSIGTRLFFLILGGWHVVHHS